jgi:hypothetical protein
VTRRRNLVEADDPPPGGREGGQRGDEPAAPQQGTGSCGGGAEGDRVGPAITARHPHEREIRPLARVPQLTGVVRSDDPRGDAETLGHDRHAHQHLLAPTDPRVVGEEVDRADRTPPCHRVVAVGTSCRTRGVPITPA